MRMEITASLNCECNMGFRSLNMLLFCFQIASSQDKAGDEPGQLSGHKVVKHAIREWGMHTQDGEDPAGDAPDDHGSEAACIAGGKGRDTINDQEHGAGMRDMEQAVIIR